MIPDITLRVMFTSIPNRKFEFDAALVPNTSSESARLVKSKPVDFASIYECGSPAGGAVAKKIPEFNPTPAGLTIDMAKKRPKMDSICRTLIGPQYKKAIGG